MISFIIIGRNEGEKLTKSLNSVVETIKANNLNHYEIIYVDSNSSDNSIERATEIPGIRIFKITGHCNAALARNIGADEAKGGCLFFIDGDMEIIPSFLSLVYNENYLLVHPFVTGTFSEIYYEPDGAPADKSTDEGELKGGRSKFKTGGLFLIDKNLWLSVKGMDSALRVNEDIDLGLRIAKKGINHLCRPEQLAVHHTVSYQHRSRMWRMLFSGAELYRAVTLRKNLFNIAAWGFFIRTNYTTIILIASIIAALISGLSLLILIYPLSLLARTAAKGVFHAGKFTLRFIYTLITDLSLPFAFLLFFPAKREVKYETVSKGKRTA